MTDSRIPLKNPYLAVFLGLLIPGGGQLYQGRTFKGVLYAVCIVSTFVYGMFLSDWTALYAGNPLSSTGRRWGFLAQTPIGAPAVYAVAQKSRYGARSNVPQLGLEQPISAPFEGVIRLGDYHNGDVVRPSGSLRDAIENARPSYEKALKDLARPGDDRPSADAAEIRQFGVEGTIELRPISTFYGPAVEGRLTGHLLLWNRETQAFDKPGKPIELKLNSLVDRFEMEREIYADPKRGLEIGVIDSEEKDRPQKIGELEGTIPRSFTDWFAVPLEKERLGRLHSRLGKTYDLALIYTWVASLLNVLVLWDAFEGPAYGYGDEKPEKDPDSPSEGKARAGAEKSKTASESKTQAATT